MTDKESPNYDLIKRLEGASDREAYRAFHCTFEPVGTVADMNELTRAVYRLEMKEGGTIDVSGHSESNQVRLQVLGRAERDGSIYLDSDEMASLLKSLLGAMIGHSVTLDENGFNEIYGRLGRIRMPFIEHHSEARARVMTAWYDNMMRLNAHLLMLESTLQVAHASKEPLSELTDTNAVIAAAFGVISEAMGEIIMSYHGMLHGKLGKLTMAEASAIFRQKTE